jgi:hypothetical protein
MKFLYLNSNILLKRASLFVLAMICFHFNLSAQNNGFFARANKSEVPLNQTVQVTYTFENVDQNNFSPPNFAPFNSLGQSQSSSMNFINGKMSKSVSFIFTLRPTKEGTFEIPPATATVNGKSAKSNPINITVIAATAAPNPVNPTQPNIPGQVDGSIEDQIKSNLFLKAISNKTSVYEGEQIALTYKILYLVNVQDYGITKEPTFNGMLSQNIELSESQQQRSSETFNGQNFYSNTIRQYAIFPTRSGSYTIDPMETEWLIAIERNTRSFFRQYEQVKYDLKSNPVKINVKPLPTANRPKDFNGVVGSDFTFDVTYDKTETEVDNPITLKIKIAGKGNIKLIGAPQFELPSSFEVYDPETKENLSQGAATVSGSKSFDYLIVPRGGGEFQFPDLTFSYFDLNTEKYVTKTAKGPLVKVEGKAFDPNSNNFGVVTKEDIELLGEDIKYIKTEPIKLSSEKKNLIARPIFHVFTWTPILLAFFIPFIYRKRKEANKDQVKIKSKKAHKVAAKRLTTAKNLAETADDKAFYNEIVKSIWGYLADKFNVASADLSKEMFIQLMQEKSVDSHLINETTALISTCEMAIYAPQSIMESKQTILRNAAFLIENLEKEMSTK